MRKKITFLFLSVFAIHAFASMEDFAKNELSNAQKEYVQALERIEKQTLSKRNQLQEIYGKIKDSQRQLAILEKEINVIENLKAKKAFYKGLCKELSAELIGENAKILTNSVTSGEIFYGVKQELESRYNDLKSPLKLRPTEAIDIKTKEKIVGDMFRIGGQRYFVSGSKAGFLSEDGRVYGLEKSSSILDFILEKTSTVPVDTSFGVLLKKQSEHLTFTEKIKKGGVWIYPILFLGVLSIVVFLFKIIQLFVVDRIENTSSNLPVNKLKFPFDSIASAIDGASTKSDAEDFAFEAIVRIGAKLKHFSIVLSITAAVSPLFGLLGTVSGIIKTFSDLSLQSGQAKELSSGIAEALITTEYGLIVAIPALIAGSILSSKTKRILEEAERFASERILNKKWAEK